MLMFLTHMDVVRANLFSINPRQKMTPTIVCFFFFCFVFFFTVKLDPINSFASITAEARHMYLKLYCCGFMKLQRQLCDGNADANADDLDDYKYLFLYLCCCCCLFFFCFFFCFVLVFFCFFFHKELMGHIMRNPVFVICEQQRRRLACASTQSDQRLCCSLLDSNEIYSSKLYSSIGTYLQPVSLRKASYLYMYICLSLSLERCYTDSVYLCTGVDVDFFCDKSF